MATAMPLLWLDTTVNPLRSRPHNGWELAGVLWRQREGIGVECRGGDSEPLLARATPTAGANRRAPFYRIWIALHRWRSAHHQLEAGHCGGLPLN
jgi:hypothetical protein